MPEYRSAVYEPAEANMPLIAVILNGDEVKMAFVVSSVVEGERKLRLELRALRDNSEASGALQSPSA